MIVQMKGTLVEKTLQSIIVDVSGVGYELLISNHTYGILPEIENPIFIFTHFIVREDAQLLYGFATATERMMFRELIKINSVGPKLALAVLSHLSAADLKLLVDDDDAKPLVKIPGVGKRTAERLLMELRNKAQSGFWTKMGLSKAEHSQTVLLKKAAQCTIDESSIFEEAMSALVNLGYKPKQAEHAIMKVISLSEHHSIEDVIRLALKSTIK